MAAALAICTMMRDERPYIEEWLAHHKALGVEKFLIYIDQSKGTEDDGTFDRLVALAPEYKITVYGVPKYVENRQLRVFQAGVDAMHGLVEWVAFIDCDEFLRVDEPLVPWLQALPAWVSGVAATQLVFGSSGRLTKPTNEGVLSAYRRRATISYPEHAWFKSIVRPQAVSAWANSHEAIGPRYVTGDGLQLVHQRTGCSDRIPTRGVRLHHYMLKSREEWLAKKAKGALSDHGEFRRFTEQYAARDADCNLVLDETLVPALAPA